MSDVIDINAYQHMTFKGRRDISVTVCPDSSVIYNGRVTTLKAVTCEILGREVKNYRAYWSRSI